MMNIATMLFLSCVDTDLNELKEQSDTDPSLIVTPGEIHFGIVEPLSTVSEVISLRNDGTEAIELLSISLDGSGFTIASPAQLGWLEAGEETEFWVDYTPIFVEDNGWVTIESNDPYAEELVVPLSGQGAYPLLVLDPPLVNFGWTEPNVMVESGVFLRNEGLAELTVTETLLLGAEFDVPTPPELPLVLAPGEEQWLDLTYESSELQEHTGSLWVQSNTENPTSHVQLIGGSSDKPIAVCDANPLEVTALRETTTFIGEDSFDPSGEEINEYNWVIVEAPLGSMVTIIPGPASSPNRHFRPDVEGSYTAKLVVYNEFGHASDPCFTTIEAIIQEDPCLDPNTEYDEHPQARLMVLDHALPLYVQFMNGSAGYTSELWLHEPTEIYLATGNQTLVGTAVNLQSIPAGSELKFRIDVLSTGDTFYSGLASQNPDGRIHVAVTYLGECRWHIGFEDQFGGGDQDFDDINLVITGNLEMRL